MKTTLDLLDGIRVKHGLTSDYQLSKLMDCTPSAISNYRNGRSHLDEEMALKVAALLDVQPGYVLACSQAERAKSATARRAWTQLAARAAMIAGVIVACFSVTLAHASAPMDCYTSENGDAVLTCTNCARRFFRFRKSPTCAAS